VSGEALLGIDIGGTYAKLAVVDARGRLVSRGMIETRASEGPAALFERVLDVLPGLTGPRRRIGAAGIGCAGLIDRARGYLYSSPNLPQWSQSPISRIGRKVLGVYTCIDNDANVAAFGEYHRGVARRARMFVCITLGTGVGGAIVADGSIVRGASGFAGEIGHVTVNARGPRCKCGNRGCLEAYVGADALVRSARRRLRTGKRSLIAAGGGPLTPETIARAARRGDRIARDVLNEAAEYLGTAIASVVNLLNPDCVALAGGVAGSFDLMRRRLHEVVAERAFAESARAVRIQRGSLGVDAASIGAALMARASLRQRRDRKRG
jgi:glucokinase